ncbi:methenyltetrahydrofolate cyclohydrolase [Deinococcus metallilatus]|uniref:Cyclodeaminase/cyclohydrolase family protein n=1 Tax=Deinococcus metallilatus TaxID=1211322 RepID=A0AAJ5F5S7_9DEIO|nr:cyclodeaminase/cyclohydrolase family protein [Deinococcus metallilatus]MBB5294428.1 formiminotetrahydrofolate cyclodeaminase [Deinococcus metallilatus]QBY10178.1 methenyltetrahydrofolate cyclohydrolase [Deinococcus metallilatus]RXJ13904.1 methenyltetrahydrofolate cyclohydrolase [Deinococcus metallilatus]TLK29870.1 cyclodeaminase/cyclohydrolase family protein [Deinococcus metallilatus]GMA15644.1 serine cycle enzyme [Deinococcus metallilatus]
MSSLWQRPALDLLQAAASGAPTPGGSTAALTGAFGAALLEMALHITLNKHREGEEELLRVLQTATGLRERLQALADEDVRAFGAYVQATRLPQDTPAQERERAEALDRAERAAVRAPLELARTLVEALNLARQILPHVHTEVTSDVGAGAAILAGALRAGLLTAEINLPHLPEEERPALRAERDTLQAQGTRLVTAILRRTRARLGGD